jgi:MFS family permease
VDDPIIDLRVLREKPFVAANIYNFIYGMGIIGVMSFIPLFAVSVMNLSTLESGFILTPRSIAMIAASLFISINLTRWGYRRPIIIGTLLTAATLIALALLKPGLSFWGWSVNDFWLLSFILLVSGLGQGIVAPPANNACIELMPSRIGTITGVRGMFRHVGGAISVAITALVVHNTGDIARGFFLVLIGLTVLTLLSLPVILMMPSAPTADKDNKVVA